MKRRKNKPKKTNSLQKKKKDMKRERLIPFVCDPLGKREELNIPRNKKKRSDSKNKGPGDSFMELI